jgi:prohibitin 1
MEKTGSALIEVRRIDAAKEIAGKLANSRNITYLPSSSGEGNGSGSNLLLGLDTK